MKGGLRLLCLDLCKCAICRTKADKLVLRWGMDYNVVEIHTIDVVQDLLSGVRDEVTTELMMEPCNAVQLENCFWCRARVIGINSSGIFTMVPSSSLTMTSTSWCLRTFKKTFMMATLRRAPLPFCFPSVVSMILVHSNLRGGGIQ